jgi:pyrroloquinoline quinone biosynthesis protein E
MTFEGGDPLVRADLPALIDHANDQRIEVCLVTNADAATPAVVDALKEVHLEAIRVRLQGASPTTCDTARGYAGAFRTACDGIDRLRSLRIPIALQFLVTRDNAHELDAMAALVKSFDLARLIVTAVAPLGSAADHPDRLLSDDDISDLVAEIDRVRVALAVEIDKPRQPWDRLFKARCGCGTLRCHVDARGGVSPAGILSSAAATDSVRGGTLEAIWRTSAAFQAWLNRPRPNICPVCDYYAEPG